MKIFSISAFYALMMICLPHLCDGCLDMLLKSLVQVFNPTVETGPHRLIDRHRYRDGFMPDYRPVPSAVHGYRNRRTSHDDRPTNDAVAVDYGDDSCGRPVERPIWFRAGRAVSSSGYVPGDQPLTDFLVSLLETIQLTSRATLKKSMSISGESVAHATTTTTPQRQRNHVSKSIVPLKGSRHFR